MRSKRGLIQSIVAFTVMFGFVVTADPAFAAHRDKVLYRFCPHGSCGSFPFSGVIFDASGNLYGTTSLGGVGCPDGGTVFELLPSPDGKWTERTLYSFRCDSGGFGPYGGVIFDKAGNLYGTTPCSNYCNDVGTVFQLIPHHNGQWTEKVLHGFGHPNDGATPYAGLISDAKGNLYGTTLYGGTFSTNCHGISCGTVFQLKRGKNGRWKEKVLHSFNEDGNDGFWPEARLMIDGAGNLYGTASGGGTYACEGYGCGVVFELIPGPNGKWTEEILHSFNGKDGAIPVSDLILDSSGNLYGTTIVGGDTGCGDFYHAGCGTVFELMPGANGKWKEKVLRSFYRGRHPVGGVILDAAGNLYGTTTLGGHYWDHNLECPESCGGVVFKLSPGVDGRWTAADLHDFGNGDDGNEPVGSLIFDAAGNLYGTTEFGGDFCSPGAGCGTVFEITP